ncbi:AMP-dependent synthetase/ligase [Patulibacter minatonensis]|uniref:AMP-dependent synthetase/ligase n=1 Tax=Patulibacter minatonensis TaxID=298163 RepID=UPI0004B88995|nr:long-chain fatty acid--CoA ligase [Patulibacter minatonensis]
MTNPTRDDDTTTSGPIERALGEATLCAAFLQVVRDRPDRVALRAFGSERTLTYGAWHEEARRVAGGLHALGVGHGDRVALLLTSRLEFHVADMGALLLGAVPFSAYATSPVAQLEPSIVGSASRVLITEASMADEGRELLERCPGLEHLVVIDGDRGEELDLFGLQDLGPDDFDVEATAARVGPEDLCSLVYTSGTTGAPKGVPYLHRCLMATMASIHGHTPVSEDGRVVSYLPMAHIAERMFGHYAGFVFGCEITTLGDPTKLGGALAEVRPTRFFGVPRIWEKLLSGVHRAVGEQFPAEQAATFRAAWGRAIQRVEAEQAGTAPAAELDTSREADDAVLGAVKPMLGLDRAEWLGVAGAPAGRDTLVALHALGLPVNELYGMSETIIVSTSPPERVKIGTCGVPLPGVEVKLADDGEILVSGVTTMPGYLDDEERTAEVLKDGWMHSGDIGTIDADGYLTITDRKKALIINSAGKNMSPAMIEQAIKGGEPLIGQVVAVGDARRYNVALIVLDPDGLEALRASCGLAEAPFAELSQHPEVLSEVDRAVREGNEKLARVEQIKSYRVLDHVWLPASDQLTPTAKLKRGPIEERYAAQIDELYA